MTGLLLSSISRLRHSLFLHSMTAVLSSISRLRCSLILHSKTIHFTSNPTFYRKPHSTFLPHNILSSRIFITKLSPSFFGVHSSLIFKMEDATSTRNISGETKLKENRLAKEKSPYLLHHKNNPVDWYPWSNEAFQAAKSQNKLIFLSVGYSSCHWCNVMAHESFENPEIAALMNKYFINIKVDREERPDVDKIYMTYLQATSGGGGWPMSVFLTPDLKPVFAGTYFPPIRKFRQPSFPELIEIIQSQWQSDPQILLNRADKVMQILQQSVEEQYVVEEEKELTEMPIDLGFRQIKTSFDPVEGGFSHAPKFPRPSIFDLLFKVISKDGLDSNRGKDAIQMATLTLKKMAKGGMYDHVGGGFHRYSVTTDWHVPHFEKMLYDNSQLVVTYLTAFQLTKDKFYEDKIHDILKYVLTKLTHSEGGFFSSEDADSLLEFGKSEHAEGAFYLWKKSEIDQLLGSNADLFNYHFGVLPNGNVGPEGDPHREFVGKNILIQRHSVEETAQRFGHTPTDLNSILQSCKSTLYSAREKRPRPRLDDKIITAWNGLMISAFSRAFQVFENAEYLNAAIQSANFIRKYLFDESNKTLLRHFREGPSTIKAFADDYSFLIAGLLDLYEACFDIQFLDWAITLQSTFDRLFWDSKNFGYYSVQEGDPSLLLRMKEDYDGAEPSNNSVAASNLLRLASMTGKKAYQDAAQQIFQSFSSILNEKPVAMPLMVATLDFLVRSPAVIVILGDGKHSQTRQMLKEIHHTFLPNRVLILLDGKEGNLFSNLEYLKDMKKINDSTTVYVCKNFTCQLPVNSTNDLSQLLKKLGAFQTSPTN